MASKKIAQKYFDSNFINYLDLLYTYEEINKLKEIQLIYKDQYLKDYNL